MQPVAEIKKHKIMVKVKDCTQDLDNVVKEIMSVLEPPLE
jgi:hypothetical protein